MIVLCALCALCIVLASAPASSQATETVQLHTGFTPDAPGASTTVTFGFTVEGAGGGVPAPLRSVDLHLPAGIGLARNSLGLAVCNPEYLNEEGPEGCPENSQVGFGTALAEIPYGPTIVQEEANVYAYRGESSEDNVTILFYTEAHHPVYAALVFPGEIVADSGLYSGSIDTNVPLIPSVPDGPDVSVVRFQSTFGPKGLTYHHFRHGHWVAFSPRGVTVPRSCPPGGYPFAAEFSFADGSSQTVASVAPCPAQSAPARSRSSRGSHARRRGQRS